MVSLQNITGYPVNLQAFLEHGLSPKYHRVSCKFTGFPGAWSLSKISQGILYIYTLPLDMVSYPVNLKASLGNGLTPEYHTISYNFKAFSGACTLLAKF
jgi:hypothetical protein